MSNIRPRAASRRHHPATERVGRADRGPARKHNIDSTDGRRATIEVCPGVCVLAGIQTKNRRESRKPNSVPPPSPFRATARATIIPLAPSLLTGSSSLPGSIGRTVLERFPIWPCSVRGFACHPCCHGRGALLPHLFTLTSAHPAHLKRSGGAVVGPRHHSFGRAGHAAAVYFLCHYPSGCPDRALPGALPCGVRTFLSPRAKREGGRSSGSLGGTSIIARYPSFSCVMAYCSSFL
jgi:hypothetical protein